MNLLTTFTLLMGNPQGGEQSPFSMLIFFGLMILVFYFFMIRPQMKRQKELTNFRKELKKGDKVITTGGIFAKVADVKEDHLLLEIADDVKIKVDKNSVVKDPADIAQPR
ncbi:MAG: preprotein translocase subunit YajC [Bacteroidales bacterium]|nr:preprotein translocase subunit YajC [Bacteroidales bacterium]